MKSIVAHGGVLAHAVALVLDRIRGLHGEYHIRFVPSDGVLTHDELAECIAYIRQDGFTTTDINSALPSNCVRMSFPTLDARHLWPFHCPNPFNKPEPPRFPAGRFPFGDSFVISCLQQNVDPDRIVSLYLSREWGASWPDLDAAERQEYARLEEIDERVDLKMLPFVREHLQRKRLFWAPAAPTNFLLAELVMRMLETAFPGKNIVSRKVLEEMLHRLGDWELFGAIAVPVHPTVAKRFGLAWCTPAMRYNHFGESFDYRQYFERMVWEYSPKPPPSATERPTLIVYGNCQGEAIAVILRSDLEIKRMYDVRYVKSFGPKDAPLEKEVVEKCTLLLEQHDPAGFAQKDELPSHCTTVRFPSIDCNVLWPFNAVNRYNDPEPAFPFGRFPYGDRVIMEKIDEGKSAADILDYYLNGWDDYKIDLDRLLKMEIARFAARDARCDVSMGTFLYERFTTARPLWTANHPTLDMLKELMQRILKAAARGDSRLDEINIDRTVHATFAISPRGPLGVVTVPVHPKVAQHFDLTWYRPDELYPLFDGTVYSYEGYFEALIAHSLAKKMVGAAKL